MAMERHFLGWDRPGLPAACEWLIGRFGVDLRNVIVVLPGGRAGRRLMELLVETAEGRDEPLLPPRITTVGGLAEQLIHIEHAADDATRQLMWAEALRGLDAAERDTLIPHPPGDDDLPGWVALAADIERLHVELIGEGVSFDAASRVLVDEMDAPGEAERWAVLAAVESSYVNIVTRAALHDPYRERWQRVRETAITTQRDIVVIGAADLNRFQRDLLDAVADRVHILVHAPKDRADDFDAHGCVVIDRWTDTPLPLDDDAHLAVVQRPIDQAMEVVRTIARLDGAYPAEQITLGVCDDAVSPYLRQMLPGYKLDVRDAAGTPMSRTGPVRLLAVIADYLDHDRFADFAALLRHPDLNAWLLHHAGPAGASLGTTEIDTWLGLMDRYYTNHLQERLSDRWLGDEKKRERLKAVHDAVHHDDLLGALLRDETGDTPTRKLSDWTEPIVRVLVSVYGHRELDRTTEPDRTVIEVCDAVRGVLAAYRRLPEAVNAEVSGAAALRLVVGRLSNGAVPPEADALAIEMLGPLELPLDDAAVCIVTGFNEGMLPESMHGDPLLPDGLRVKLGVFDNRRRYARDVYAVTTMLHSKRTLRLIAGRRDASGDPLRPSRLMFAAAPDTIAHRINTFYGEGETAPRPARLTRWEPGAASGFVIPPRLASVKRPHRMRVTDFKNYLDCKYRFALGRLLELEHVDDTAAEMNAMQFGNAVHDVLERFATSAARDSTDAEEIQQTVERLADEFVAEKYGDEPLPAVIIQREQVKHRLRGFSNWQAGWRAAGWRIVQAECAFTTKKKTAGVLELHGGESDDGVINLTGKIDRVDYNEHDGTWAVLDYKTSDKATDPEKAHRKGKKNDKQWVDLQLPLYRTLVRSLVDEHGARVIDDRAMDTLKLGYVVLPKDTRQAGALLAAWSLDELDEAEDEARRIVREIFDAIETGEIAAWEPEDMRADRDDFAWITGVGQTRPPGDASDGDDGDRDDDGGDA